MVTLPLEIRYRETPQREPSAWLLPAGSPGQWLDELVAWQVPLAPLRLYVVPQAHGDLRPGGLLVVGPGECRPPHGGLGQPYGRVALRLYLPVEAAFHPEIAESELSALLEGEEKIYLFHPQAGLIGFEAADALGVSDLLQPPPRRASSWDRAEPGIAINHRLLSIEPDELPAVETVLGEGRDDIGSQPVRLEELPRSPDEPSPWAAKMGQGFAGMMRFLRRLVPRRSAPRKPAPQPGAASTGGLGSWAGQQLARMSQWLEQARHREALRLLNLLSTNPDQGLRFAIPFGQGGFRGLGSPSARLPSHGVDFNLGRLGGAGPADPWSLPFDLYQKLRQKYVELADRELRLRRYRRAAYIYGELLGMLDMAASALTSGRHWREAAVLYRRRLNRPDEAARCLEQGGLWTEAIALYEELGNFEKAGDLYTQLDQADNARQAYRRAIQQQLDKRDFVSAARLLEQKLDAVDEALKQLAAGWPDSSQAETCLRQTFSLLGRLGRHDDTRQAIDGLRQQSFSRERTASLVDILADAATRYPHDAVRNLAADATRTIVARRLRTASLDEGRSLLGAVSRLVPEDRLLGRDCQRYLEPRSRPVKIVEPASTAKVSKPKTRPAEPALVRKFGLLRGWEVDWQCAAATRNCFFAAGYEEYKGARLVVAECLWDGAHRLATQWNWPLRKHPVLLAPHPQGLGCAAVQALGHPPLPLQAAPITDRFPQSLLGTPPWMPENVVAAVQPGGVLTWAVAEQDGALVLHTFSLDGQPLASRSVPSDRPYQIPVPLHIRSETAYLGLGNRLVKLKSPDIEQAFELAGMILSLAGSQPHSRPRIAAALEQGISLLWDDYDQGHVQTFAEDLEAPVVAFTPSGWLVAADAGHCRVYRTGEHTVRLEASLPAPSAAPLAILNTSHPHQFALLMRDGAVEVYEMPPHHPSP